MTEPEINGNLTHNPSVEDLSEYTDADESISAPTEILAEFLSSIMMKDYESALKYCKTILSYEPNNATAKEFYPLIMEKLELMQREEESDESSSDSSESSSSSANSTTSNSCSSSSVSKKCSDSEDTSGSFTSLEDDADDDKSSCYSAQNHSHLPMDVKNGNINNIEENISSRTMEKLDQILPTPKERKLKSPCRSLLIHPTETKTIKHSDSPGLRRTRTYVKDFSSELQKETSVNDSPALEKHNREKVNLQSSLPKKMKGAKKTKSSHTSSNSRAKKI